MQVDDSRNSVKAACGSLCAHGVVRLAVGLLVGLVVLQINAFKFCFGLVYANEV